MQYTSKVHYSYGADSIIITTEINSGDIVCEYPKNMIPNDDDYIVSINKEDYNTLIKTKAIILLGEL
jgi:PKD repeat protein